MTSSRPAAFRSAPSQENGGTPRDGVPPLARRRPARSGRARLAAAVAGAAAVACAGGLAFRSYPEREVAGVSNPHDYRGKPLCQRCHPDRRAGVADPLALCLRCHQREHGVHPQGHPLGMELADEPERLPLWRGRLACHTCHDPHDVTSHRAGLRMDTTPLCLQCHRRYR